MSKIARNKIIALSLPDRGRISVRRALPSGVECERGGDAVSEALNIQGKENCLC
jgi:hypothetical protein